MAVALPLPLSPSGDMGEGGDGLWIVGAALGIAETVSQFRLPPVTLPPVTGRELTVEEMIRDYAAAASIGVGIIPPGGPGGPDPRLSFGLAAAAGYGAWQLWQLLKDQGPAIQRWGHNLWAWLNRQVRGETTTSLPNVPDGVRLTYKKSPRRTVYRVELNRLVLSNGVLVYACPYVFATKCGFNLEWLGGSLLGEVAIIPSGPPTVTYGPPYTAGGRTFREAMVKMTGTTSTGATVERETVMGGNAWGLEGSFSITVFPTETNTSNWTETTNAAPFVDLQVPAVGADLQAAAGAPLLPPAPPAVPIAAAPMGEPIAQPTTEPIAAPIVPPVMAPIRVPLPGAGTAIRNGALPAAAPAPAPTTDPGAIVPWPGAPSIPAVGPAPRPTVAGVATEMGRLERKLELMMTPQGPGNLVDRFGGLQDLIGPLVEAIMAATSGTTYTLDSPCEVDAEGNRLPALVVQAPGAATQFGAILNRLDALAELLQAHKDLKQPNCRGADIPIGGEFVTVNFEQID